MKVSQSAETGGTAPGGNRAYLRGAALAAALLACAFPAAAANWFVLQGTEAPSQPDGPRFTGFIDFDYQYDTSRAAPDGSYIPPKLIGPDLDRQTQFTLRRIRLGLKGRIEQGEPEINYAVAAEFGNNGITAPDDRPQIVDASVTAKVAVHHWLRMGMFKTPGSEEGLQAIHVADYINFSTVTNQLVQERPPNEHFTGNSAPLDLNNKDHSLTGFNRPIAAFRDVGVMLFGVRQPGVWEQSYAVMIGNGNGLSFPDNDGDKDLYLYLAAERVTAGKGGRRQGLKLYVWSQRGKREYDGDDDGVRETYDRRRSGLGTVWRARPWRLSGEYIRGYGMIFLGPDKPSFDQNGPTQSQGEGLTGRGEGGYLEGGWYIPGTAWELDLRLDRYDRLSGDRFETRFETATFGTQYHLDNATHFTLNFSVNRFEAINFPAGTGPNAHLDGVQNRWAVSLFAAF